MKNQRGFTLVEMVVVAPTLIISITVVIAFMVRIFLQIGVGTSQLNMQSSAQLALFTIRDEIGNALYFQGTEQPDTTDPHKPTHWNAINDNALIINEVAYTAPRQNPLRQIVYKKDSPAPCTSLEEGVNQFSTNTIIYFVSNSNLYSRFLVPNQDSNCLATHRKQSCPPAVASVTCPSDTLLAEDVKSFNLTYYTYYNSSYISEVPIVKSSLTDPGNFIKVTRVDIELVLEKLVNAEPVTESAKISLKRIN